MARSCLVWASQGQSGCICHNSGGDVIEYAPTGDTYVGMLGPYSATPYEQCCINNGVGANCASGIAGPIGPSVGLQGVGGKGPSRPRQPLTGEPTAFAKASGFKRARRGGTGQSVTWRKQSGSSEGGLFGLSTTQLLIAGAVGVGAYLILKKRKK